jgi:hypothetical protein
MGDVGKGEDPVLVRKFVHEVTPSGLEQQLKDAMAEEVRSLARALKHTDVYSLRSGAATVAAEPIEQGRGGGSKGVKPGMGTAAKSLEPGFEDVSSFGGGGKGAAEEAKGDGVEMTAQAAAEARPMDEGEASTRLGVDVTQMMEKNLNEQFVPQGVMIHDIMIQNVSLPDDINQQMSNKTLVRSKQE